MNPRVYHLSMSDIFGKYSDTKQTKLSCIHDLMAKDQLTAHIVLLAHGSNPNRTASTIRMLNMLHEEVLSERVRVWLSYQGTKMPSVLSKKVEELGIECFFSGVRRGLHDLDESGKTENIISALIAINNKISSEASRHFVAFIDNDYLMYDSINIHALYSAWVLQRKKSDPRYIDKIYIKSGGGRLKLKRNLIQYPAIRQKPMKFVDACIAATTLSKTKIDGEVLREIIPSIENLKATLTNYEYKLLDKAIGAYSQYGARSSRALTCYLFSRAREPAANYLARFSFLLHGDQGASLSTWNSISLARGYGLELSFLCDAMLRKNSVVLNVITLPHAHIAKTEIDNFQLGVEMFELLRSYLDDFNYMLLEKRHRLTYFAMSPLGFNRSLIKYEGFQRKMYKPVRDRITNRT